MGAAGGILAAELAKAGLKVIGLEQGPRLTTQDFNAHDELRYFQRMDLRPKAGKRPGLCGERPVRMSMSRSASRHVALRLARFRRARTYSPARGTRNHAASDWDR
jgi:choline dehydrogenase-like flavoprotein